MEGFANFQIQVKYLPSVKYLKFSLFKPSQIKAVVQVMKRYFYNSLVMALVLCSSFTPRFEDVNFKVRIVASGLSDPWSVVCAPSGKLWLTESKGYRVIQLDPPSGVRKTMLDLNSKREFPAFNQLSATKQPTPQGGFMGLALHPDFEKGKPYVYLSYVYKYLKGNQFQLRLARYRYDSKKQILDSAMVLCDTIPASNDHNGGRLIIASVKGKSYLFYSLVTKVLVSFQMVDDLTGPSRLVVMKEKF